LEQAVYLYTTLANYFTVFLSQLQGLNGTELICLYIVLYLRLSESDHSWKRRW